MCMACSWSRLKVCYLSPFFFSFNFNITERLDRTAASASPGTPLLAAMYQRLSGTPLSAAAVTSQGTPQSAMSQRLARLGSPPPLTAATGVAVKARNPFAPNA